LTGAAIDRPSYRARRGARAVALAAVVVGLAAASLAGGGAGGCAQQRAPINRVQANALAKSFFVGADLQSAADDPEFYKRGTVVDVVYGAAQDGLFTSSYGEPLSRIRWEITEDSLNARLSYERISGTDDKGNKYNGVQLKAANDGQIVASYKILSQFDIKKDYNPQTGETLNVVDENTTDRVWNQREYFRVDWSKNLVSAAYDYDLLALLGAVGGVRYEPFTYTVLDPAHPDAPHFSPTDGYFDVTNKVYAVPQQIDLASLGAGSGTVPACLLPSSYVSGGAYPAGDCNPVELTIRESFRRVVDTDYEAMDFDGVRFQALGAFNFNFRRGYTRNYGLLDQEWSRFISRFNLWNQSHFYADPTNADPARRGAIACATQATTEDPTGDPGADPNRDLDGDGTADECAGAGSGSRCDVFTQTCTLPYRDRTVRTIPWYVAGDTSLFDPTNWAAVEWDLAMRTAVQTARLVECRKTGAPDCDAAFAMWRGQQDDNDEAVRIARDVDACRRARGWDNQECVSLAASEAGALAAERGTPDGDSTTAIGAIAAMAPVFVLCHNPVVDGDHPACGAAGLSPRTGDLRYNTVLSVAGAQSPSPWGITTDADDPLTGEKVAASINVWTATTDRAAQALVDIVRYVNGELSTDQITNGSYIRDWVSAAKLGARGGLPTIGADEIARRLAAGGSLDLASFKALAAAPAPPEIRAVLDAGKAAALDVQARNDVPSPTQIRLDATLAMARGSDVETQLVNPAILQLAGLPPTASLSGAVGAQISPLGFNNPLGARRIRELRENALAARGACVIDEAPEPSSVTGLAAALGTKFPAASGETPAARNTRYDRMFQYVRRRYHYSVVAHEMGHSVGLRHNFAGSSASLFYRPQYWQLRTGNGQVHAPCTDAVADGAACVGPRYWDPVTDEEQSNLIWMWMQSTVMDYPGDASQDMLGLGATDFAAVRFFYGDSVSVYASPAYAAGTSVGTGITAATDTFGGLLGIRYGLRSAAAGGGVDDFHYARLQDNYNVVSGCHATAPAAPASWDAAADGAWSPLLDGHVVSVGGQPTACRQQAVDYVGYAQLRQPTAAELNGAFHGGGPSVDPAGGRTRVPYAFAADNWADIGNVSVLRDDSGADPYEQVQFLIANQESRHIFDDYRRGRSTFSLPAVTHYAFNRYSSKLQAIASGVGFLASIYQDLGTSQGYSFKTLWPLLAGTTQLHDNVIAATVVFDQLTRELSRPEPGRHYRRAAAFQDPVLHSSTNPDDFGPNDAALGQTWVVIPNGTTGYLKDVGFGGHVLENALSTTNGDYNVEYVENAGSYYDKINTAILFSESEDRFVSQSRRDFYDARFRSAGLPDLLPQGFRRVIGNALTGDRSVLAPRVEADGLGTPLLDSAASTALDPLANLYPARPLGWVSLWPAGGAEICFPTQGRNACTNYAGDGSFAPLIPPDISPDLAAVDPQIGWEVQKFLIAWTIAYIKANQKTNWTDMMRLWRLGQNAAPEIDPRLEWQDPTSGEIYYARALGTECLFGDAANSCAGGQMVQQGIAARVLEYANRLTAGGYKLDVAGYPAAAGRPAGFNAFGRAMVARQPSGAPVVKSDPAVRDVTPAGGLAPTVTCDQNVAPGCTPLTVDQNHWARELQSYKSVPDYLWQVEAVYGWINAAGPLGVF
jgi:hypothetical protein